VSWGASLALAVVVLAAVETFAATRAGTPAITADDWRAVEAALPEDAFPVLGTPWLGPRARAELAPFARPDVVGAPDLRGHARLVVLTARDDRAWRRLVAEGLGLPTLDGYADPMTSDHGALSLHVLDMPSAERITDSLAARLDELRVETPHYPAGRCKLARGRGKCSLGAAPFVTLRQAFAEVDHTARHCATLQFELQGTLRLSLPEFEYGARLLGHVGVHDFNQRLRNDAATTLEVTLPDGVRWTATHTDRQGWAPFEIPTTPGAGPLTVDITTGSPLRFDDAGDLPSTRTLCLELRGMAPRGDGPSAGEEGGE
jgi:hypothetical protein